MCTLLFSRVRIDSARIIMCLLSYLVIGGMTKKERQKRRPVFFPNFCRHRPDKRPTNKIDKSVHKRVYPRLLRHSGAMERLLADGKPQGPVAPPRAQLGPPRQATDSCQDGYRVTVQLPSIPEHRALCRRCRSFALGSERTSSIVSLGSKRFFCFLK